MRLPSGTAYRQEREDFYNVELTYLLGSIPPTMIIGGSQLFRVTGRLHGEHEPQQSPRQIGTWLRPYRCVGNDPPPRAIYTHYTPHGVARLDRMYLSPNVRSQKSGAETVMAAFTDNLAVRLRITLDGPMLQGRGRWKMNVFLLDETMFKGQL